MAERAPFIPETVTVHLGPPDSPAENVTVPFIDYVKNVASSEIYPTWPESAIRANIYAQISFALNRIYTEYYRSRGYGFDITNNTAYDQAFVNGREIFSNISATVDEIFDSYVARQGNIEPLAARYCNGTTTVCSGLSQWGSVALANDGLGPVQILEEYYGDDVGLITGVPVYPPEQTAPSFPLTLGSAGEDVFTLQNRLNRISVNYRNIPKIPEPNGIFDLATQNAVKEFQRTFSLSPDGIVFTAAWYEILRVFSAVKRLSELDSEGIRFEDLSRQFSRVLGRGAEGYEVGYVQYFLNFVSQYLPSVSSPPISSVFDEATETAVREFQLLYGLDADGIVGEKTYDRLYDVYLGIVASLPPSVFVEAARPYPGVTLLFGSRGQEVRDFQSYLNTVTAALYPEIPQLAADGDFGANTDAAVRLYQQRAGFPVNGVVGALVWNDVAGKYDAIRASAAGAAQYPGREIGE